MIVETGQSDARAQAVFEQARKAIPNKPIRYVVNTHHHFDHASGLPCVVSSYWTSSPSGMPAFSPPAGMPFYNALPTTSSAVRATSVV